MISYLLSLDPVICRLTKKYLLDEKVNSDNDGYIKKYLDLFDPDKKMWGGGIYSPKWISTHYTLLELVDMEVDPGHPYLHQAMNQLLKHMWFKDGRVSKYRHQDMCVVAMMVKMACYLEIKDERIEEMMEYIINHQQSDGGWNCMWETAKSKKSSLHTTLSVLEAISMYVCHGYLKHKDKVMIIRNDGESFIFRKRFFRSETTGEIIHEDFATHHYPTRWKYDYFRAMWYFAKENRPFHPAMEESIHKIKVELEKGYLTTGKKYSGKTHFVLESRKSGFNTLRALYIMKIYNRDFYQLICS